MYTDLHVLTPTTYACSNHIQSRYPPGIFMIMQCLKDTAVEPFHTDTIRTTETVLYTEVSFKRLGNTVKYYCGMRKSGLNREVSFIEMFHCVNTLLSTVPLRNLVPAVDNLLEPGVVLIHVGTLPIHSVCCLYSGGICWLRHGQWSCPSCP